MKRIVLIMASVILLAAAALLAQAQFQPIVPQTPTIITGNDIGFRMTGRQGNKAMGALVVRVNGQWLEAESEGGVKRLTNK